MTHRRWGMKLLASVFAVGLVAAGCGDDSSDDGAGGGGGGPTTTADVGGTLVWVHDQEPVDLHLDDPNNMMLITSWVVQAMWEGLFGISADLAYVPELLAGEPTETVNPDGSFTVDFTLRDGLRWSDGTPLTAEDVRFTYDVIAETDEAGEHVYLLGSRAGYDTIVDFTVTSETEFSITWSELFAGYPSLFARVFPAHAFGEGAGAAEVNEALVGWRGPDGQPLPSSGPLVFESWDRGVSLTLARNDDYHGSVSPDAENDGPAVIDAVRIDFVDDSDAQVNALLAGEADFVFALPQVSFGDALAGGDFEVGSLPGPAFEHIGFNLLNPHLAKPQVREAIALAVDKAQIVTTLYEPLYGDLLPPEGLGNAYWMTNQGPYRDHQGDAGYGRGDAEAARAALEAAGYAEGADGVYAHPTDGRLSLRIGTTGGNRLRELQQQIIQQSLAAAGIELVIDNVPGGAYFTQQPFSDAALDAAATGGAEGDPNVWDIAMFAMVGGPWPGAQSESFRSGGFNNPYAYANPEFDAVADRCEATADEDERAACYDEADLYVTTLEVDPNGLVVVPLTQQPSFYAYATDRVAAAAVAVDANDAGPLVHVVDFQLAG